MIFAPLWTKVWINNPLQGMAPTEFPLSACLLDCLPACCLPTGLPSLDHPRTLKNAAKTHYLRKVTDAHTNTHLDSLSSCWSQKSHFPTDIIGTCNGCLSNHNQYPLLFSSQSHMSAILNLQSLNLCYLYLSFCCIFNV